MGLPEILGLSRKFAVLVKVEGPDPKGLKMRKHAFHQYHSGNTTVSASGMLLPCNLYDTEAARRMFEGGVGGQDLALVLTVASVLEPFLTLGHRTGVSREPVKLIPGARIEIMVEGQVKSEKEAPSWVPAQLFSLVDVPVSSFALQSLTEASLGSKDCGWDVGWSLVSYDNGSQPSLDIEHKSKLLMESRKHVQLEEPLDALFMAKSACRMALLGVPLSLLGQPNMTMASSINRGDTLVTVGSPFGILSPVHFFNSISTGSVANFCPPGSLNMSLLIADVRCLPGSEGGPVFDKNGRVIGILIRPLRQKSSGVEIQLVIPWGAIATAYNDLLLEEPCNEGEGTHWGSNTLSAKPNVFFYHPPEKTYCEVDEHHGTSSSLEPKVVVESAMKSICLITVNDGVWASGVLLNEQGLILTNAHLLEPWRFGKGGVNTNMNENGSRTHFFGAEEFSSTRNRNSYQESRSLSPKIPENVYSSFGDGIKEYKSYFHTGHRDIRVRMDHLDSWVWCSAKVVYICKEQLDVALLQLEYVPGELQPIVADFSCPPLGSRAHVIGHGLFGPRCGLSPSVCSGVVAKVVKMKKSSYPEPILPDKTEFPAMLETTAAVHPGGSGGAVVNSCGHMIGLVTSNARHGAGTVIPHLNFSIPCAVLAPIFKFAKDMQNISVLQTLDQPNGELSSIWALMPPLSPKPKPALPGLPQSLIERNSEQKKGSQFAKFIAETQNMLGRSSLSPRGEQEKLSNDVIPSKL